VVAGTIGKEWGVAAKEQLIDHSEYDLNHVIADADEIRRHNPHRFELQLLSAIVYDDLSRMLCVGYLDTSPTDFWVRGHMPGAPLMPGVLMCEAGAQMACFYTKKHDLLGGEMVGLGGLEGVRFRGIVRPGDRLVIVVQLVRVRRGAMVVGKFQQFVERNMVCEGEIRGIPLTSEMILGKVDVSSAT
jgi:3-hydroxyacyl-[acyl-carrier-protein] dehydratase